MRFRTALWIVSMLSMRIASGDPLSNVKPFGMKQLQANSNAIGSAARKTQIQASIENPDTLLRAFPTLFWKMMKKVPAKDIPGGTGIIAGDSGAQNIGFVRVRAGGKEKTVVGVNDFDDPGKGPVALDADHFFTELRLRYPGKEKLVEKLIKRYVDVVKDPKQAVDVPAHLQPSWAKIEQKVLSHSTDGDAFDYANKPNLKPLAGAARAAVERMMKDEPQMRSMKLLDVADKNHPVGGSGGVPRRLLLVEKDGERRVIELKGVATPGIDAFKKTGQPSMAARMPLLKKAFWGTSDPSDQYYVKVGGERYLARDLGNLRTLDPATLKKSDRKDTLEAMSSYLGTLHRPAWKGVSSDEMYEHIKDSSKQLADVYEKSWKDLSK